MEGYTLWNTSGSILGPNLFYKFLSDLFLIVYDVDIGNCRRQYHLKRT